jgi:polyhydroxybutyrate depolymerase
LYVPWVRLSRSVGVVIACALMAACSDTTKPSATSGSSASSTPPACARPHAAGQTAESFDFDGVPRSFQLYVPAGYDGSRNVPVVFNFHGFGSNAVQQMTYADFKPEADQDTFLIVAPDGQGGSRHFNLTNESGLQDDIAMVDALLDHLEATLCVDAQRVFSTGMSDGGAVTSVLACRKPDRFAAFGAVAVILYRAGCGGSHPIAIAAFMGTGDPVVPFDGGPVRCCGGVALGSAPDALAGWAEHDGCSPEFSDERIGTDVRKRTWSGCQPGGEVVFYIVDGGGHTWPGAIPVDRLGKTTTDIDASATIWEFFKAHPLS